MARQKKSMIQTNVRPKDCKELLSFLGSVTYLGPFIPNLSDMTSPLRELIKKNQRFEWNDSHQMVYMNM